MGTSDSTQSSKKGEGAKAPAPGSAKGGRTTPTPPSPLLERGSPFRRSGSIGKGSIRTPTTPHRPMLATEARSLVRPCHCGKDGVFRPHTHTHDSHHHKVGTQPEKTCKERTPKSPLVVRKARVPNPPPDQSHYHSHHNTLPQQQQQQRQKEPQPQQQQEKEHQQEEQQQKERQQQEQEELQQLEKAKPLPTTTPKREVPRTPQKPDPKPKEEPDTKRVVSTVVWYPQLQPKFNTTNLSLCPGEDYSRYVDEILVKEYDTYLKSNIPNSDSIQYKLEGDPVLSKKVTVDPSADARGGPRSLIPQNLNLNPITIS